MAYETKDIHGAAAIELKETAYPASAFTGLDVSVLTDSSNGVTLQDSGGSRPAFPTDRTQLTAAVIPNAGSFDDVAGMELAIPAGVGCLVFFKGSMLGDDTGRSIRLTNASGTPFTEAVAVPDTNVVSLGCQGYFDNSSGAATTVKLQATRTNIGGGDNSEIVAGSFMYALVVQ